MPVHQRRWVGVQWTISGASCWRWHIKILTGHEKGVLSLSWCKQDADLLLSCGKDNRALCWNPQTSEIIGEVGPLEAFYWQLLMFNVSCSISFCTCNLTCSTLGLISIVLLLVYTIAPFRRQLGIPSRMVPTQPRSPRHCFLLWYRRYSLLAINQRRSLFCASYPQAIRCWAFRPTYTISYTRAQP